MLSLFFSNETDADKIKKKFVFILSIMAILSFNNICGSVNTGEMSKHRSNSHDENQTYPNSNQSENFQICYTNTYNVNTSQEVNESSTSILKRTDQMPQEALLLLPFKKRKSVSEFHQPMNLQPEGLVRSCVRCVLGNGVNPSISCNHSHPDLSSPSIDMSGTLFQIPLKIPEVSFRKEKKEALVLSIKTKDGPNLSEINGLNGNDKTSENYKDSSPQLYHYTKIGRYKKSLISNKLENRHNKFTIDEQIKMIPVSEKDSNYYNYEVALGSESEKRTVHEEKFKIKNSILSGGSIHDLSTSRIPKIHENHISVDSCLDSLAEDHGKTHIRESSSSIRCDFSNNNDDDDIPSIVKLSQKDREIFLDDLKYLSSIIASTHSLRLLITNKNLQLDEKIAKDFTDSVSKFKNQTDLFKPFFVKKKFYTNRKSFFRKVMNELDNIYLYEVYPMYFKIIKSLDMDPFFYNFSKFLYLLKIKTFEKTIRNIFDIKLINNELKIIVDVPDYRKSSYALALLHTYLFLIETVNIRETKLKIFNVAEINFEKNVSQFLDDKKYENLISLPQMKKYTELLDFLYFECKCFIQNLCDVIYERNIYKPQTFDYFKERIQAIAAKNIRKTEENMKRIEIVNKKPKEDKSKNIKNSNREFFTFLDHILTTYPPEASEYLQHIILFNETEASNAKD